MTAYPRLLVSPRSPFARRVRLATRRLGFAVHEDMTDVFKPSPEFLAVAPLGQIPVLLIDQGQSLPDSGMILEYLHDWSLKRDGAGVWPQDGGHRTRVRRVSALALGVMTATVNTFVESEVRKIPMDDWSNDYADQIHRACSWAQAALAADRTDAAAFLDHDGPTQGAWDWGVALGYMDFRMPQLEWRSRYPALQRLWERCNADTAFQATAPTA